MKIALYTKDPRLRTSPRHGGQEVFLHFSHRSTAQEAPSAAAFIVTNEQSGNNLRIISEYYDFHRKCLLHVSWARDAVFAPGKKGCIKWNFSLTRYPQGVVFSA